MGQNKRVQKYKNVKAYKRKKAYVYKKISCLFNRHYAKISTKIDLEEQGKE